MRAYGPIRLVLLVAAGVTSGYLWRAVLEPSSPAPVAVQAEQVAPLPQITFGQPAAPERPVKAPKRIAPHRRSHASALAARQVAVVTSSTGAGRTVRPGGSGRPPKPPRTPQPSPPTTNPPKPSPQPQPAPSPTPSPAPSPAPSTSSQPPTDSSTPPASSPVPPTSAPTSAPPPTTTPPPTPPPPPTGPDRRPGWGHGDDNHDHDKDEHGRDDRGRDQGDCDNKGNRDDHDRGGGRRGR